MSIQFRRKGSNPVFWGIFLISISTGLWAAEPGMVFYPDPVVANGKKVYLSPARHSNAGGRGECPTLNGNENTTALASALHIVNDSGFGLLAKGYEVRIGRGTLNTAIMRSNQWKADIHIPLHSNARTERCSNGDISAHGAVVIYRSDSGKNLSSDILHYIQDITPGTRDFVCHESSPCTAYNSLAELRKTKAVAAYIEREFHTWDLGARYLRDAIDRVEIATGIQKYFNRHDDDGRPRWWSIWTWWPSWSWSRR